MPSAATKARREAAKKAREEEEAALRERLAAAAAAADEAMAAAAQPPPPSSCLLSSSSMPAAAPMELEATLAMLNPSTQEDEVVAASPPKQRKLQPSAGELSEGRCNLVHRLEQATPRGTHQASAEYKTAAATPEGEDADSRCKRLATERQRLCRARSDVQRSLDQQVEAEQAVLAEKAAREARLEASRAASFMRWKRHDGKSVLWDEMGASCRAAASQFGFMRGLWNMRDSREFYLVDPLIRQEWWWPWTELPRSFKIAAVNLGYDRLAWQIEQLGFPSSGYGCTQRYRDMEECEMYEAAENDLDDACSDGELISGHDWYARECEMNASEGTMDTMDLLAQPSRRSYCQGAFAAYRPKGGCYVGQMDDYCRDDWSYQVRAL